MEGSTLLVVCVLVLACNEIYVASCATTKDSTGAHKECHCNCYQTTHGGCGGKSEDLYLPASCKDIFDMSKANPRKLGDGVFDIRVGGQRMKVYCDMTRDGGGWTLITTATTSYGWSANTVLGRNVDRPSLNHDYSILEQADAIKSHAKGPKFQYRIEVNGRGRWGGIWTAPVSYTFTSTTDSQTSVDLVKKFDSWTYNKDHGVQKRMPWFNLKHCCALLTVRAQTQGNWWGTLIMHSKTTGDSHRKAFNVAPWIAGQVDKENRFYYWLREN